MDTALATQIGLLFLKGTAIAVVLTIVCEIVATILALILAAIDIYGPRWASIAIRSYSWLAQTLPPLILLFLAFYGFTGMGIDLSPITSTLIAFVIFATAYNFEIIRASYEAVPAGQAEAARSLGLSLPRTFQLVVLPQMIPVAIVPYIGRATVLFKETSLASAISVPEIMSATNGLIYSGADPLMLVLVSGAIYAVVSLSIIGFGGLLGTRKFESPAQNNSAN